MPDSHQPVGTLENNPALDAFVQYTEAAGASTDVLHLARHAITALQARFPDSSAAYYVPEDGLWKARAYSDDIQGDLLKVITDGLPETPLIREVLDACKVVFRNGWDPEREEVEHSGEYTTVANYPVMREGEVHGILALALRGTGQWTDQGRALVHAVGRGLTLALERAEHVRRGEEERHALAAFADFTEAVSRAADISTLVELAFSMLPARFPQAAVGYYEPDGDVWRLKHYSGNVPEQFLHATRAGLTPNIPAAAEAILTREVVFVNDWNAEQQGVPGSEVFGKAAVYPLTVGGEVGAALVFGVQGLRHWGERDQALVRGIGRSLALAYERTVTTAELARQKAELQARTRALEAFATLTRDLSLTSDPRALVRTAQEVVLSLLPAGYAVFYELDEDTWRLTVQTGDLRNPTLQTVVDGGLPYLSAQSLVRPWTTYQPWYQDEYDVTSDSLNELVSHVGTTAALPVLVAGAPIGVFLVALFGVRRWSGVDRAVLESVVRSLGLAAEGARDAAQLMERTREVQTWRERYEVAVRGSGHLLYDWDPATDQIVYGGAVEAITGYTVDELEGNLADWTERLIHPDDRAAFGGEIGRVIQSGDEFHLPFRVVRKDGSVRRVEDDGFFRRDETGRVTRMVGFVKDVTEVERVLTALRRSNAELDQFASVASHDLQAPIRAVTSFAEVIARRYEAVLDERGRVYLRQIVENGEHMKRLIDGLMTYSRVSREEQRLLPTDANAVFDAVLRRLQPEIEALGATMTRGDLPTVLADAQQLDQLLQNLVGNALKYHREGVAPVVQMEAQRDGTCWRFSLGDNGLGIEPMYFEKIFGMFQRLHGRGKFEGTGIGLSVCQRIVERHGGKLWVDSEPGRGSSFHFTLQDA